MACEYCMSRDAREHIRRALGSYMHVVYCPCCGSNMAIVAWFFDARETAEGELTNAFIEMDKANETVEIDGETLTVEHVPPKNKKKNQTCKPMDMGVDLDKIDIAREMAMLEDQIGGNPLTKHREYISERVKQMIKEKQNVD